MITVHHLEHSRSQRILWLLEELGLKYEIKRYQRHPKTLLAPPELKKVHPLGKSPVITDGETTVAESAAILEYLLEKYGEGRLQPAPGTSEWRRYRYFMHYPEGSMMTPLVLSLVFSKLSQAPVPIFMRPVGKAFAVGVNQAFIGPNLKTHFGFVESELSQREWFAGPEFTAADIQMSYPIEVGEERVGYGDKPAIKKYLERIHARPAYQRAEKAGGPVKLPHI